MSPCDQSTCRSHSSKNWPAGKSESIRSTTTLLKCLVASYERAEPQSFREPPTFPKSFTLHSEVCSLSETLALSESTQKLPVALV